MQMHARDSSELIIVGWQAALGRWIDTGLPVVPSAAGQTKVASESLSSATT